MPNASLRAFAVIATALAALSAAPPALAAPFTNVVLVTHHSGKCLDVADASTADDAQVQQWTCVTGRLNQQWTFTSVGDGYYTVHPQHSGKCLDVATASTADGERIHQWTCFSDRTNQQWRLVQRPNGYFTVVARHSGKCLDVAGTIANGLPIQQWTCDTSRVNQEWRLT
ncbi:RICIN domain-containing protein [Spongiactinospora gelatinilytica]|nr:RICIN domain-containing protein [Spongiactinospora gelatinilytica]